MSRIVRLPLDLRASAPKSARSGGNEARGSRPIPSPSRPRFTDLIRDPRRLEANRLDDLATDQEIDRSADRAADQATDRCNDRAADQTSSESRRASTTVPRQDLRLLTQKLVQTFRVGQTRGGQAVAEFDLKNTVFDGMTVRLTQSPRGLQATFLVDNYATQAAIEGQLSELLQRLKSQNIVVAEMEVELRHPSPESESQDSEDPDSENATAEAPPLFGEEPADSDASRSIPAAPSYSL